MLSALSSTAVGLSQGKREERRKEKESARGNLETRPCRFCIKLTLEEPTGDVGKGKKEGKSFRVFWTWSQPRLRRKCFSPWDGTALPPPPRRSLFLAYQRFRGNKASERTFTTGCFQSAGDVTMKHAEKRSDSRLGKRENRHPRGDEREFCDSGAFPLARVIILRFRILLTSAKSFLHGTFQFSYSYAFAKIFCD